MDTDDLMERYQLTLAYRAIDDAVEALKALGVPYHKMPDSITTMEDSPIKAAYRAIPRCETCRWWGTEEIEPAEDGYPAFAPCNKLNSLRPNGEMRWVWDKGYDGDGLYPTPDFGCVLWEKRDG